MNGILLIDKPEGITSFDVVSKVRKIIGQKKVGHAGTLDPMATGVLPVLLGKATKLQSLFPDSNKEYIASFKLGISTDTQDITGNIISEKKVDVRYDDILDVLKNFRGEITQIPPMFSAVKKDGTRLYDLARQGIEVKRESRNIMINKLELIDFDSISYEVKIKVLCSKGTYIRTLCDDIGNALGCGATMTKLRRISACGFTESQILSIENVKYLEDQKVLEKYIIPIEKVFSSYSTVTVSEAQSYRFSNGGALFLERLRFDRTPEDKELFCVYSPTKIFLGLGVIDEDQSELCAFKIFETLGDKRIENSASSRTMQS